MDRLTHRVVDEVAVLSGAEYLQFWVLEIKRYERTHGELEPCPSGLSDEEEKQYDKYAVAKRFLMDEGVWEEEEIASEELD